MPGQTVKAGNYEKGQDTSREDGDAPGHHIDDLGGNTTSVKPVDSPNEQTVSRDQRTGTTVESAVARTCESCREATPMSTMMPNARGQVRMASCQNLRTQQMSWRAVQELGRAARGVSGLDVMANEVTNDTSSESRRLVQKSFTSMDKTHQRRERSTNDPYNSPEPPWPPDIPTNHTSEPTTRQEASIKGENGHVGARTINDRADENDQRSVTNVGDVPNKPPVPPKPPDGAANRANEPQSMKLKGEGERGPSFETEVTEDEADVL
ncbi:hypothetical protein L210DRAFT_989478 [Boletus edulis BED1]|uniref:Uncharacterized protein n=1 Tax=Boletus edulis BED1 TaxID=1328754 RepID=A0AAD4GBV9_BOLED|nr:hypothetical protein L210DRAFT_989478 [Boletus edulis BED1]